MKVWYYKNHRIEDTFDGCCASEYRVYKKGGNKEIFRIQQRVGKIKKKNDFKRTIKIIDSMTIN